MKVANSLPWLIIFILLWGACARQTSPTGGPKDTIPPVLLKNESFPKTGTTNFTGQTITLKFNEAVILNTPKDQIIITPDVQKKYDIAVKKNTVVLEFEQPLLDTTTYTLHFRASIQDITEKNPAKNLKLAFSTGHYIDSLSIAGTAIDPLTTSEPKNITVAIYQKDTFNIFIHRPSYITQSDEKGRFSIENLKPGTYYIYAIDDKNRNLIADSKSELYGFLPVPLELTTNQKNIIIPIQKLDARELKLISSRPYNTYYYIKSSKSLVSYRLTTEGSVQLPSALSDNSTAIKVYNTTSTSPDDSLAITLHALDSVNNVIDTTLYAKFSARKATPEKFTITPSPFIVLDNRGTITGDITFTKPLKQINFDSISYQIDSLTTIPFQPSDVSWDSLTNKLKFKHTYDKKLTEKPSDPKDQTHSNRLYQLLIGKAAFISVENDSSERQQPITSKPLYLEDTGVLRVKIETTEPTFVVDLLDKSFKIIRSTRNNKNFAFEDLPPGEYMIRFTSDKNNDGKWTPGNFSNKQPTEPTKFYQNEKGLTTIKLKANFDIGPMLITF